MKKHPIHKRLYGILLFLLLLSFPTANAADARGRAADLPFSPLTISVEADTDKDAEEDTAELFAVVEDPDGYPEEAFLFDADPDDVDALKAYFREQIWNAAESIPVNGAQYPSMSFEEVRNALSSMHYEPDMFLFSGGYRLSYSGSSYTFFPNYNTQILGEYEQAKALYSSELKRILSTVDPDWSEMETVLYLNDYVATHYMYDFDASGQPGANHDAYSMLRDGYGVCEAYSNLMVALLDGAGMEASYVMSDSMNHMWNMVRVDGQWYHVDTTWNDSTKNGDKAGDFIGYPGYAGHDYFLLSTNAMQSVNNGSHYRSNDWVYGINAACNASRYDQAAWKSNGSSPFIPLNGKWYHVASNGLYAMDSFEENSDLKVLSFAGVCRELYPRYIWNDDDNYSGLSGMFLWNGELYFNTFYQILRYDPMEETYAVLQDIGVNNGSISGCGELNGQLVYFYQAKGNNPYTLYGLDLPKAEATPGSTPAPTATPTNTPTPTATPTNTPTPTPASGNAPSIKDILVSDGESASNMQVTVEIENQNGDNGILFVAAYAQNGQFLRIATASISASTIAPGSTQSLSVSLPTADVKTIKALITDANYMPLCDAVIYQIPA